MTLPELFYFLNFFVRPVLKKRRQKCAKKRSKCALLTALTPRDPFLWLDGMCTKLPRPNNPITLLQRVNPSCFVAIIQGLKWAPPDPPDTQKSIFLVGGIGSNLFWPKNAITLLFRLLSSFLTFEGLLAPKCAKNWPSPPPPWPPKTYWDLKFQFPLEKQTNLKIGLSSQKLQPFEIFNSR